MDYKLGNEIGYTVRFDDKSISYEDDGNIVTVKILNNMCRLDLTLVQKIISPSLNLEEDTTRTSPKSFI